MQKVIDEFTASIHRVHIIHALAECIGEDEVVSAIEKLSGKVDSEGELVRLEKRVLKEIINLRSQDKWPPQKAKDSE